LEHITESEFKELGLSMGQRKDIMIAIQKEKEKREKSKSNNNNNNNNNNNLIDFIGLFGISKSEVIIPEKSKPLGSGASGEVFKVFIYLILIIYFIIVLSLFIYLLFCFCFLFYFILFFFFFCSF